MRPESCVHTVNLVKKVAIGDSWHDVSDGTVTVTQCKDTNHWQAH